MSVGVVLPILEWCSLSFVGPGGEEYNVHNTHTDWSYLMKYLVYSVSLGMSCLPCFAAKHVS